MITPNKTCRKTNFNRNLKEMTLRHHPHSWFDRLCLRSEAQKRTVIDKDRDAIKAATAESPLQEMDGGEKKFLPLREKKLHDTSNVNGGNSCHIKSNINVTFNIHLRCGSNILTETAGVFFFLCRLLL